METCPYCGEEPYCTVSEVDFDTRELMLDTCCEPNLAGWLDSIREWSRRERSQWMLQETGIHIKGLLVTDDTLHWTLDYGLDLGPIAFPEAKEFIRTHHRECEPPVGWKFGKAVFNGSELVGVVTAGRPVSPALAAQGCLEINRVCVKERSPHALVENACSMLYGYACREAFKRGHKRVITYTNLREPGTSLRATGFTPVAITRGGSWNRRGRPRTDKASTEPKIRWERWKDCSALPVQQRFAFSALLNSEWAA
jgi:hypothetical protein